MSGSRPSSFKKGGGKLNGVAAVITGYQFTDDAVSFAEGGVLTREPFTAGKVKGKDGKIKEKFHTLNTIVSFRVDGAEEDMEQPFFSGGAEDFAISEDGLTIWDSNYETAEAAAAEEDQKKVRGLGANTAIGAFIASLCEAGFPDSSLSEDTINFEPIIGTRVQLVQREDPNMKGKKRKGKDGKEYAYTQTVVDDVLALPDGESETTPVKAAPVKTAKPVAKAAGKPVAGTKSTKASTVADLDGETEIVLAEALAASKTGTVKVTDLSMYVLKHRMNHPQREALRSRIVTADFLSKQSSGAYDKAAKTVSRVEEEAGE